MPAFKRITSNAHDVQLKHTLAATVDRLFNRKEVCVYTHIGS